MSTWTIGEAAERTGFTPSALRYYEQIGLAGPSARSRSGYRLYDEEDLSRLAFVARAKQLGCSLEEIADLVSVRDGGCDPVQRRLHALVTEKLDQARAQIGELTALTGQLREAAAALAGPTTDGPCTDGCACMVPPPEPALPAEVPIACTLEPGGLEERRDEWRTLLAGADRHPTADGGLRIDLDGVDLAALAELVAAEQGCCAFFAFAITVDGRGRALEVRAPEGAEGLVTALFG